MNSSSVPNAAAVASASRTADDDDQPPTKQFRGKPITEFKGKQITEEMFKAMMGKGYNVRSNGTSISGENKHGHTLYFMGGFVFCQACDVHLPYPDGVNQHIAGKRHRERVSHEVDSVEGDSAGVAAAGDEAAVQAEIPESGDSQNALPVQDGSLVMNGFDVIKYIRWLEGRITKLEMKLAENATPSTENDTM